MLKELVYPRVCLACRKELSFLGSEALDVDDHYVRKNYQLHEKCYRDVAFRLSQKNSDSIPLFFTTPLNYSTQFIVLQAKEKRDAEAIEFMARYLLQALTVIWGGFRFPNLELVPIPSRFSNRWKRGYSHLDLVIKRVILLHQLSAIGHVGSGLAGRRLLLKKSQITVKFIRRVSDQRGLNSHQRISNVSGSMQLTNRNKIRRLSSSTFHEFNNPMASRNIIGADDKSWSNSSIVLIDDVMTTGASMREAMRALFDAGLTPIAGVSFAATDLF